MTDVMELFLQIVKEHASNPERVSSIFRKLDEKYDIEREEARDALWLLVSKGQIVVTDDMKLLARGV